MEFKWTVLKEKLAKIFKNKHIAIPLVIALMCIALLICFGSFGTKNKTSNRTATSQTQSSTSASFDALKYADEVAASMQSAINCIKGISNAKVIVVVESSPTMEYLTEDDGQGGKVLVYDKQGSTYKPIATCQFLPKITGVLVVAKGVSDLQIKYNILNAISAVYNVNVSNIEILEGK